MKTQTVCIPTVNGRENQFQKLYKEVDFQIKKNNLQDYVSILVNKDNKEISIGKKRQLMLLETDTDFISFIDDDDQIHNMYIPLIFNELQHNIDCIGFKIKCNIDGIISNADSSKKYKDQKENENGFRYVRTIYHKNPIKTEIAKQIGFLDKRFGEDYDYSKRLKNSNLLQREIYIDEFIYHYNFKTEKGGSKVRYGQ